MIQTAVLVEYVERRVSHGGKLTNMYNLGGLVTRLKKLGPDFPKVEEDARKARLVVSRRDFEEMGPSAKGIRSD